MTMIRRTTTITALALAVLPSLGASASQDRTLATAPAAGTIATYAGGGVGDGRPATKGLLVNPTGIAFDAAGNLYIADAAERRVRVVRKGIMTTLAGTGDVGTSGDGGPATAARFDDPAGVAVDGAGNVYVSDTVIGAGGTTHANVRRIDTHGVISTLAGNLGVSAAGGLAVTRDGTRVYVPVGNEVVAVSTADGSTTVVAGLDAPGQTDGGVGTDDDATVDGGPATQAPLNHPNDVALDGAGNLYIADTGDCRVREVSPSRTITTVLGGDPSSAPAIAGSTVEQSGSCSVGGNDVLRAPVGVAIDGGGRIYVSDEDPAGGHPRILLVTQPGSPGNSKVVMSPGGDLASPLAIGPSYWGGVYAASNGDAGGAGAFVYPAYVPDVTIAGQRGKNGDGAATGEPATGIYLEDPSNVSSAGGQIYITDLTQLLRIDSSGTADVVAGTGALPVYRFLSSAPRPDPQGHSARSWDLSPAAVTADPSGNLYVALDRLVRIDPRGMMTDVGTGDQTLSSPNALLWANGALYITDGGGLVIRIGSDGTATVVAGGGDPVNAAVSQGGCSNGAQPATGLLRNGVPARQTCLEQPSGLAMDAAGNLYFAETGLDVVDRVTPSGILTAVAGVPGDSATAGTVPGYAADGAPATSAMLSAPQGVAVDGAGNLYIADTGDGVIRKVDSSGTITTVVGGVNTVRAGTEGSLLNTTSPVDRGDGGTASAAYLQTPVAVAVDTKGNLYIADSGDGRIRVVGGIASAHAAHDAPGGAAARHERLNRAW